MNSGFVKGTSVNLPKVDLDMLICYLSKNDCYISAEMRGVKTKKSMRPNYGDKAIGYVQVSRSDPKCIVEAKVCPEHRVHNKNYVVIAIINETEETIVSAECRDCAASLGGCKHAIALLAWLYRRSEEPSPTSVICYWQKPKLSEVGTNIKFKKIKDIAPKSVEELKIDKCDFLEKVLNFKRKTDNVNSHLIKFFNPNDLQKLSLHYNAVCFDGNASDPEEFLQFCAKKLTSLNCKNVSIVTSDQSENSLWFELRYGRISASKVYDAAQCRTLNGSLVEQICGSKSCDTIYMRRGRYLENKVIEKVRKAVKVKIDRCGLILNQDYPQFGASPDGVSDDFVFEVKCPSTQENVKRYYCNGQITKKFKAQIQLQMLFAKKKQGYFCIASPDFEKDGKVTVIVENFDEKFIKAVISRAVTFWIKAVYPVLME